MFWNKNISTIAHQKGKQFAFTKEEWYKSRKAKYRLHIIGYEKGHLELKLLCWGPVSNRLLKLW